MYNWYVPGLRAIALSRARRAKARVVIAESPILEYRSRRGSDRRKSSVTLWERNLSNRSSSRSQSLFNKRAIWNPVPGCFSRPLNLALKSPIRERYSLSIIACSPLAIWRPIAAYPFVAAAQLGSRREASAKHASALGRESEKTFLDSCCKILPL